jgi:hypothetical protein
MTQPKENFNYKHAKSSWMSALEAFKLVGYLAEIGAAEGSIDSFMREGKFNQFYEEVAKPPEGQSDFRTCVPLVYTLINGIELYIKACEYAAYPERVPKAPPKLTDLLAAFAAAPYPKDEIVKGFINTYTTAVPSLLERFLTGSGKTIADLLRMRRHYSFNGFFAAIEQYEPLLFDRAEGKHFFAELLADVTPVIPIVEAFVNGIDEEGNPGLLVKELLVA